LENLWIKDESLNPTGSFKARGLAVAVTKAKEVGAKIIAVPTAGNAGAAAAAYAARADLECVVVMPADTPTAFKKDIALYGARLIECDGLIDECVKIVKQGKRQEGWYDVSTLKEPYRVEGKKTMGLEIAEQMGWELPDAVIYPTGGGTGLIGMWKAWSELEMLGWIDSKRPKMYAVQAYGCQPVVEAFEKGLDRMKKAKNAWTSAFGLRVPKPFADEWILQVIRESNGKAMTVTDDQMLAAAKDISQIEGILACPEGGATLAALYILLEEEFLKSDERVVIVNTGSATKYL
jgi:threonine synthase